MRLACLFAFVSLIAVAAAQTPTPSRPNEPAGVSANTAASAATQSTDLIRIAPNLRVDLGQQPSTEDRARAPRNDLTLDPATGHTWDSEDFACYAIRSYRMVRDNPNSDSTHRDGYTTCVPAARFHYYTAVAHER